MKCNNCTYLRAFYNQEHKKWSVRCEFYDTEFYKIDKDTKYVCSHNVPLRKVEEPEKKAKKKKTRH